MFSKLLAVALLLSTSPIAGETPRTPTNVGFQRVTIPDAGHADLEIAVWYPTDAPTSRQQVGFQEQGIALGAELAAGQFPLLLISHGNGGLNTSHADTAFHLASTGLIAAAVTHTGDNARDVSAVGSAEWLVGRPRHIRAMLDFLVTDWPGHEHVDQNRISIFGFSMGGYTALALIGGAPDVTRAAAYCPRHLKDYACDQGFGRAVAAWQSRPDAAAWPLETRIHASVLVAPALGFLQDPERLAKVRIPIQMWTARLDEGVPEETTVHLVRDRLGARPEFHTVPDAHHFDFLSPCNPSVVERLTPFVRDIQAPHMCGGYPGFDRAGLHERLNQAIGAFLERALNRYPAPATAP